MHYESLIFDLDGTLWDSRAASAEGYNIQLRREGIEDVCVTAEDLLRLFGKTMTAISDELFPFLAPEARYALLMRCADMQLTHLKAQTECFGYPGVQKTMEALAKKHRLFIASNCQTGYPEVCMANLDIARFISGHLCFGQTQTSKGQTIRRLMAQEGIESTVYIGDTQGDRDAAREAGIPFIWASYGFGTVTDCDARIDGISQLCEL